MLPAGAIDTAQSHIALISQVLALGVVQEVERKIEQLGKKKGLVEKKEDVWRDSLPAERQHVRGGP